MNERGIPLLRRPAMLIVNHLTYRPQETLDLQGDSPRENHRASAEKLNRITWLLFVHRNNSL
jgi:hypothetical protein